jgi:hypothetical protein
MRSPTLLLSAGLLIGAAANAAPTFVNGITIDGSTLDLSGGTSANDGRVGFFSDIYYNAGTNDWWGLSDRGPGGGTLSYDTRMQRFSLDVDPLTGAISNFQILQTLKFTNGAFPLNGRAPNPTNVLGNAFDPEGIVVNPQTGTILVSDEYGPSLYELNASGAVIRSFTTPANLIPRNASNAPNYADDTGNVAGKRTNRGFEGLAISPDGNYAYAMLQSSMLDEGGGNGTVNRIVKFDTVTGTAVAQYAYQMDTAAQGRGISALVALNDHEFLVLERNNRGLGVGATLASPDKRVYKIDITGATDVSAIDLDAGSPSYTTVTKGSTVFIDLDANTLAAIGNKSPEKWEGLAIGPQLTDGSYLILAGTDNDYSVTQNTGGTQFDVYYRFSDVDPFTTALQCPLGTVTGCTGPLSSVPTDGSYKLLPGVLHAYKASQADLATFVRPVPVPASVFLFGSALGLKGVMRRKLSS